MNLAMGKNYAFDNLQSKQCYDIAIASGIGQRESQQDAAYVAATDDDVLGVVCDGMGGIAGGQLASNTAIEAFVEYYQFYAQQGCTPFEWMQYAAQAVDDIVYALADGDGKRIGAGTTLLSAVIHGEQLHWVSVGDSRLYIFRGTESVQVTNDHNYFYQLNQQKIAGTITSEKYHSEAHNGEALISFIGMGGLTLIDINEDAFQMIPGDVILLCTDGFYRTVTEEEMGIILGECEHMQEAAEYFEKLIEHRAVAYQDNYTYILIKKQ